MPILDIEGIGQIDLPDDATQDEINQVLANVEQSRQAIAPQGVGEYAPRQIGLTARGMIGPVSTGAAMGAALATPTGVGIPVGAAAGAVAGAALDIVPRIYNTIASMAGSQSRLPPLGDVLERIKTEAGLPQPITPLERISQAAMETTTSLAAPLGAGRLLSQATSPGLRAAGTVLSEQPVMQAVQAPAAGIGSQLAEEAGAGGLGQATAGVLAAGAPTLATIVAQGAKGALRGRARPEDIAQRIQTFREAGVTPSAAQATQATPVGIAESTMGRVPGSIGVMRRFAQEQQRGVGERLRAIREELSPVTEPSIAGMAIKEGVPEVFRAKRGVEARLYRNIEGYIPGNSPVVAGNFNGTLDQILEGVKGAPALTGVMTNPKLASIKTAFDSDIDPKTGTLPYEAIKSLRSRIGENLSGVSILNDVPRAEYKRLYAALSEDMRQAAQKAGPDALRAFNRANNYSKSLHGRADKIQSFINRQEPEAIFQSAMQGAKVGGTRLNALMKSLPKEDQKAVVSAFIERMGRASSAQQNEAGEIFSTNTFLTNWNNLSDPAKKQLFGRFGSDFTGNMDRIAQTAAMIRQGSNVLSNPSGTAGAVVTPATVGSIAGSFAAGKYGFAAGMLGLLAVSHIGAKLFTNPRYVEWLARNIDIQPNAVPSAIASLQEVSREYEDEDLAAAAELVRKAYQQQGTQR